MKPLLVVSILSLGGLIGFGLGRATSPAPDQFSRGERRVTSSPDDFVAPTVDSSRNDERGSSVDEVSRDRPRSESSQIVPSTAQAPSLAEALATVSGEFFESGDGEIFGTVRTEAGDPIPGAKVVGLIGSSPPQAKPAADPKSSGQGDESLEARVRRDVRYYRWKEAQRREGVTDEEGRFELSGLLNSTYRVEVELDGYQFELVSGRGAYQSQPGDVLDFVGIPMIELPVEVVDASGQRVESAVFVVGRGRSTESSESWSAEKPSLKLRAGTYRLRAQSGTEHDSKLQSEVQRVTLTELGDAVPMRFVLNSRTGVRGVVRTPEAHRPDDLSIRWVRLKPGQEVDLDTLAHEGQSTWVSEGSFSVFDLAPGSYVFGASRSYDRVDEATRVEVRLGQISEIELVLPEISLSEVVRVRVINPHGRHVPRRELRLAVRCEHEGGHSSGGQLMPQSDGTYWILLSKTSRDVFAGRKEGALFVVATSETYGTTMVPVSPGFRGVLDVEFRAPSLVTVTIPGYLGSGYEGQVSVSLERSQEELEHGGSGLQETVGLDGAAELGPVEPGVYRVALLCESNWVGEREVTLGPGENQVSFAMPSLHRVTVQFGPEAAGSGANLTPVEGGNRSYYGAIGESGRAEFDGVVGGEYRIQYWGQSGQGLMTIYVNGDLAVSFEPQTIDALRVTIRDPAGKLAELGFEHGDLIIGMEETEFESLEQMQLLYSTQMAKEETILIVMRAGAKFEIVTNLRAITGGAGQGGDIRPATRE